MKMHKICLPEVFTRRGRSATYAPLGLCMLALSLLSAGAQTPTPPAMPQATPPVTPKTPAPTPPVASPPVAPTGQPAVGTPGVQPTNQPAPTPPSTQPTSQPNPMPSIAAPTNQPVPMPTTQPSGQPVPGAPAAQPTAPNAAPGTPAPTSQPTPAASAAPVPQPTVVPPSQPTAPVGPTTAQLVLPATTEFRNGVLFGHVLDVDGKPLPNATVALQNPNGKIVSWTKTNALGEYALAADPMNALHLRASARRGLLESCARAVGDVAMAPVKVVGSAVVNPGQTLKAAFIAIATGTPASLIGQVVVPSFTDKTLPDSTMKQARDVAAHTAVGDGPKPNSKPAPAEKGQAALLISAPNFKDAKVKAGAYWLEGPIVAGTHPLGMQAWLNTVKMAPTTGGKKSDVVEEGLTLAEPMLDQTLLPAGSVVKVQVKLLCPPGPEHRVRVFVREAHRDVVAELTPQEGGDRTLYVGTLRLDPKTPAGETILSIAALRAAPVDVKFDPNKADPLVPFVRRLDDMRAEKPYQYDPRIMASENRIDLKINVLDMKKGTATALPSSSN